MTEHTISHADDLFSGDAWYAGARAKRGVPLTPVLKVSLGTPAVGDVDAVCEAQAVAGAGALTLDGTLVASGVATMDVPRTLVIDSTGAGDTTQTLTITGTDKYGAALVETISANGTTAVAGLKAFATVTGITASAAFAGNVTVGTTDALGLPYRVDAGGLLMAYADSALDLTTSAVLGTFVAAVTTDPATATTGDVRGTYNPNATLDGSTEISLLIKVASVSTKVGAYGVDQYGG